MAFDVGSAVGYLMLDTSSWTKGFKEAEAGMNTFEDRTSKAMDRFSAVGSSLTAVGRTMTVGVTTPLVGLGATATTTAASFESAMSQVIATMGKTRNSVDENGVNVYDRLAEAAEQAGATTAFSAKEAAEALNYLALAGYDVDEQIAALPKVLNLAAAGSMDLAYASDLVTDNMSALGLATSDAAETAANMDMFIDQMARTASNSNTSVSQLGEAILWVGGTAKGLAGGTTELNTVLGLMADNGIKAAEAGTHLRNIILAMTPATDDAAWAFERLGIDGYDAEGNLRSLEDFFLDLNKALEPYTEEEKTGFLNDIFNRTDLTAINALLATTEDRWGELSGAIEDSGGAAEQMAETQLDNLSGQITILKSGIEGVAIAFGNILLPGIKNVTGYLQQFIDFINSLDDSQKQMILTIAGVAAALGPLLLILGKLSGVVGTVIGLFSGTGGLAAAFTALTGPIGLIIAVIAAFALAWATNFDGVRDKTDEVLGAIQTIVSSVLDTLTSIWDTNLFGIRTTVTDVLETIRQLFSDAFTVIVDIFNVFADLFSGDWDKLWEDVDKLVDDVWNGISNFVSNILDIIVDTVIGFGLSVYNAAKNSFQRVRDAFEEKWNALMEWFDKAKEDPVEAIKGLGTSLFEAGKGIVSSIWNGVLEEWERFTKWINDTIDWVKEKVAFWKDEGEKMSGNTVSVSYSGPNASMGGSYASGLDYVPRDMNVRVHEGEAILTKQENQGRSSGGGDTYNFYSPEALTPVKAAWEFKRVKQELALGYR